MNSEKNATCPLPVRPKKAHAPHTQRKATVRMPEGRNAALLWSARESRPPPKRGLGEISQRGRVGSAGGGGAHESGQGMGEERGNPSLFKSWKCKTGGARDREAKNQLSAVAAGSEKKRGVSIKSIKRKRGGIASRSSRKQPWERERDACVHPGSRGGD